MRNWEGCLVCCFGFAADLLSLGSDYLALAGWLVDCCFEESWRCFVGFVDFDCFDCFVDCFG